MRNPVILYHHMADKAVGQAKDLKLVPGRGLFVKAWLDKPAENTPEANIYNKVKSGTIRAFSVGGIFHRKVTPHGTRIHDVDLREISITPLPVNPRSLFEVAGKAFGNDLDQEKALAALTSIVDELEEIAGKAVSAKKRREATYHFDGTDKYPISNCQDVANAVSRSGSSTEDKAKVRAYIISCARKLDCMGKIPEDWLN